MINFLDNKLYKSLVTGPFGPTITIPRVLGTDSTPEIPSFDKPN